MTEGDDEWTCIRKQVINTYQIIKKYTHARAYMTSENWPFHNVQIVHRHKSAPSTLLGQVSLSVDSNPPDSAMVAEDSE